MPLVATAIASTSSNEDITANNEASALVEVISQAARVPARRPAKQGRAAGDRVQRAVSDGIAR